MARGNGGRQKNDRNRPLVLALVKKLSILLSAHKSQFRAQTNFSVKSELLRVIQEILYHRRLDCPLPFCLIYDPGGVSQQHWFEIIVDLPYVFILDLYVLPSQPADEHSRAPFLFNLLPCWTLPPQELVPRSFKCYWSCCRCLIHWTQATGHLKWRPLSFVVGRLIMHTTLDAPWLEW